jgi:hypothetical protein
MALAAEQRASVARDYGMTDGTLTLRVLKTGMKDRG